MNIIDEGYRENFVGIFFNLEPNLIELVLEMEPNLIELDLEVSEGSMCHYLIPMRKVMISLCFYSIQIFA